jgi:alkanesulfonate monooxygenase
MSSDRPLRFHWSLSQAGNTFGRAEADTAMSGVQDFTAQLELCLRAEESGIESMLMAIGFARRDPMLLSVALGRQTRRIGFMIACRPSLVSPPFFVQQFNTVSQLLEGRVSVNFVAGHTPSELGYYGCHLEHDERFEQADEFIAICRALWRLSDGADVVDFQGRHFHIQECRLGTPFRGRVRDEPEIYLGGNSVPAATRAARHADCLFQFAEPPAELAGRLEQILAQGKEVGLLVALIARSTREEALASADALVARHGEQGRAAHRDFERNSDSVAFTSTYALSRRNTSGWLTDTLWAGAVPYLGAPAVALVGSAAEIANALIEYKRIGVSQFLFLGWPDLDEMTFFGQEVLPLVRRREHELGNSTFCAGMS